MTPIALTDSPAALKQQPQWVQAVAWVGLPGVMALFFVWWVTTVVSTKLDAHAEESRSHSLTQIQILQRICANTADTPEERVACWNIR